MGKRVNKIAKAAHIKRNTEGTSNEISFSVLDAAKNRLDGDGKSSSSPFGSVPLFTLSRKGKSVSTSAKGENFSSAGESGKTRHLALRRRGKGSRAAALREKKSAHAAASNVSARTSVAEQVAVRKARRKRAKILAVSSIAIVALVAAGALGLWGHRELSDIQHSKESLKTALDGLTLVDEDLGKIDDLMTRVEEDAMVVPLDEVESLASSIGSDRRSIESSLAEVSNDVQSVLPSVKGPSSDTVKEQSTSAVSARGEMFESGSSVITKLQKTLQVKEKATSAWQQLLAGDTAARESAALVTEATAENLAASNEKANEARDLFEKARDLFDEAMSICPQVDYSKYASYLAKRIEAQGYAIASNEAMANKDIETATAQNDLYSQADAEAATLAESLPSDPLAALAEQFAADSQNDRDAYSEARVKASAADAFISDYLGATSK